MHIIFHRAIDTASATPLKLEGVMSAKIDNYATSQDITRNIHMHKHNILSVYFPHKKSNFLKEQLFLWKSVLLRDAG